MLANSAIVTGRSVSAWVRGIFHGWIRPSLTISNKWYCRFKSAVESGVSYASQMWGPKGTDAAQTQSVEGKQSIKQLYTLLEVRSDLITAPSAALYLTSAGCVLLYLVFTGLVAGIAKQS